MPVPVLHFSTRLSPLCAALRKAGAYLAIGSSEFSQSESLSPWPCAVFGDFSSQNGHQQTVDCCPLQPGRSGEVPSLRKSRVLESPFFNPKGPQQNSNWLSLFSLFSHSYLCRDQVHCRSTARHTGQDGCHHSHRLTVEVRKCRGISSNEVAQTPLHRISSLLQLDSLLTPVIPFHIRLLILASERSRRLDPPHLLSGSAVTLL